MLITVPHADRDKIPVKRYNPNLSIEKFLRISIQKLHKFKSNLLVFCFFYDLSITVKIFFEISNFHNLTVAIFFLLNFQYHLHFSIHKKLLKINYFFVFKLRLNY